MCFDSQLRRIEAGINVGEDGGDGCDGHWAGGGGLRLGWRDDGRGSKQKRRQKTQTRRPSTTYSDA